jgi:hypothetical protein
LLFKRWKGYSSLGKKTILYCRSFCLWQYLELWSFGVV